MLLNTDLQTFLHQHNNTELDTLHQTLVTVFEHRQKHVPLQEHSTMLEPLAWAGVGSALVWAEQGYLLLTVGCVIGAKFVIETVSDYWRKREFAATDDQLQHLHCQSELFSHRFPQYRHVQEAVRWMVGMGLSQEGVEQLTQALRQFNSEEVLVEVSGAQVEQTTSDTTRQLRL